MSGKSRSMNPVSATPSAILRDIDGRPVVYDGQTISKREAQLRLEYVRSLSGDSKASVRLQRVRDRCGLDKIEAQAGCLVVPEAPGLDEFERMAFDQQRQFREKPHSEDEP